MTLVSLVARGGLCQIYAGRNLLAFPGIVARENGADEWVAGPRVLEGGGLRVRAEKAGPEAYWAMLAEGLIRLRVVGAVSVIVGMGEEEHTQFGEELRALLKERCGGGVAVRHGDHYGLWSQLPWREGGNPMATETTTLLRVGGARVQVFSFKGTERGQHELLPGWEKGVVYPALRQSFLSQPRPDIHDLVWSLVQSPDHEIVTTYAKFMAQQVASLAEPGRVIVSGFAAEAIYTALQEMGQEGVSDGPANEAIGLWHLAQLRKKK